jgi:hypothetical protein
VRLHCARHGVTMVARRSTDPAREARTLTGGTPVAMEACILACNLPLDALVQLARGRGDGESLRVVPRPGPR